MEEAEALQYWCHQCSQTVNPVMGIDTIKCPICQSGFVEEMASAGDDSPLDFELGGSDPDRAALSLWAPILLGMMDNPRRYHHRRVRRTEFEDDENEDDHENNLRHHSGETELDRELESIMRRRRRSSATILQLLHGIRAGILSESENPETFQRTRDNRGNNNDRERERVILINPINQTIIVQGSYDNDSQTRESIGSLGDYFMGPGLDLLLQHLSENDPNRYGTPPAQKEAVEALPTVKITENLQCSVCLDDFEIGVEVKEMPCKHKFHSKCIFPWLELHSSCPVCRYQLPCDELKLDMENNVANNNEESDNGNNNNNNNDGDERNESGRQFSSLPWPFSSLFSSSGSRGSNGNSSSTSVSGSSSPNANPSTSRDEEN